MIIYGVSIEISVSLKGVQIFKYGFVTKLILFLRGKKTAKKNGSDSIVACTLCMFLEGSSLACYLPLIEPCQAAANEEL